MIGEYHYIYVWLNQLLHEMRFVRLLSMKRTSNGGAAIIFCKVSGKTYVLQLHEIKSQIEVEQPLKYSDFEKGIK